MFGTNHYVPILKAKKGEFDALGKLVPADIDRLTPVFEIPPQDVDFENGGFKKTKILHLGDVCKKISKLGFQQKNFFVDIFEIDWNPLPNGIHPLIYVFDQLRASASKAIPVTGFDRDDHFNAACAAVIQEDKRGVCIRLKRDDLLDSVELNRNLGILLSTFKLEPKDAHLILDFGYLLESDVTSAASIAEMALNNLLDIDEWDTITVAATGVIKNGLASNQIHSLTRTELLLWRQLRAKNPKRIPSLGDYCVEHPGVQQMDPRTTNYGGKIRYTLADVILVFKGTSYKRTPLGLPAVQHPILAERVSLDHRFLGATFSWGDQTIVNCATKICGPGNQTTWVAVSSCHHLRLVANQAANFS